MTGTMLAAIVEELKSTVGLVLMSVTREEHSYVVVRIEMIGSRNTHTP